MNTTVDSHFESLDILRSLPPPEVVSPAPILNQVFATLRENEVGFSGLVHDAWGRDFQVIVGPALDNTLRADRKRASLWELIVPELGISVTHEVRASGDNTAPETILSSRGDVDIIGDPDPNTTFFLDNLRTRIFEALTQQIDRDEKPRQRRGRGLGRLACARPPVDGRGRKPSLAIGW